MSTTVPDNTIRPPDEELGEEPHQPATPSQVKLLAATLPTAHETVRFHIAQDSFQDACTSLIGAVPRDERPALIAQMRHDLDIVAERELGAGFIEQRAHPRTIDLSTQEFMAELQVQQQEQRRRDLASGKLLSGAELCARLAITPQALSAALKARRVFVLRGPSGEYVYPAFFADQRHDRHILEKISKTLGNLPGAAKWDFFTKPRLSLGGKSPLDALAKGKLDAVMAAALAYADE